MRKSCLLTTMALTGNFAVQLCVSSLGAAGDLDLSFDTVPPTGTSVGPVQAIVLQGDHRIVIGGGSMARANTDGSRDTTFVLNQDPNMSIGHILAVALQPDGKLLVGHALGVARLNGDGSRDNLFNVPLVVGDELSHASVRATTVQADGKILIGGDFNYVNGEVRSSIARLNSDGSVDSTFDPATSGNQFSIVFSIVVQPDTKIVIGGQYMTVRTDSVARLNADGSLDDANFFSAKPFETVRAVALQPDGKLIIGGGSSGGIVRLNANGSVDGSFNPGVGTDRGVFAVALQLNGKVLIGGDFRTFKGTNCSGIARLNEDGSLDAGFDPGTGANDLVFAVAPQPDGNILVGGNFSIFDGVERPYLARLYGDTPVPSPSIERSNGFVILSWPVSAASFQLQETTDLSFPNSWSAVGQPSATNGNHISVSVPTTGRNKFFRLHPL